MKGPKWDQTMWWERQMVMMDGNSKVANLEKQVTDLRAQNNKLGSDLADVIINMDVSITGN